MPGSKVPKHTYSHFTICSIWDHKCQLCPNFFNTNTCGTTGEYWKGRDRSWGSDIRYSSLDDYELIQSTTAGHSSQMLWLCACPPPDFLSHSCRHSHIKDTSYINHKTYFVFLYIPCWAHEDKWHILFCFLHLIILSKH